VGKDASLSERSNAFIGLFGQLRREQGVARCSKGIDEQSEHGHQLYVALELVGA